MNKYKLLFILTLFLLFISVEAAPTKVGNGDDGFDLEGFEKVESGIIVDTRSKAVELLKNLNSPSIKYLGSLLPELEKSELYMTKKDVSAKKLFEMGAFTNDSKGLVYARTFPVAHAPTRFFPAAKGLSEDQLITLHIHEALHRSLPPEIKEDEAIVADIALAITTPQANRDLIENKINSYMQKYQVAPVNGSYIQEAKVVIPDSARVKNPSTFGIAYKRFSTPDDKLTQGAFIADPLVGMYSLKSHLFPFGSDESALGLGIDLSFLQSEKESRMGPLGISGRLLAYTFKGFDLEGFFDISLNTLSNDEIKNSLLGRDVYTVGLTLSKKINNFYIANDLLITGASDVEEQIGNVNYRYEFGTIIGAKVNAGVYYESLHVGGFLELLLSDYFKISGGALSDDEIIDTGRNRVLSIGPKVSWKQKNFGIDLYGRFLIDSTKNANYEFLGNVLEQGVGQGNIGTSLNVFF